MQTNHTKGQFNAQVNVDPIKKSGFDLGNSFYATGRIGRIIPTRALSVYPGDKIYQDSETAVQFEPLAVPMLANMYVKQEHFYVPKNIVWQNWDKFISGGENLDYVGVVPNTSLRSIIKAINSHMFAEMDMRIPITVWADEPNNGHMIVDVSAIETQVNYLREAIINYGNAHEVLDLLKSQLEQLDNIIKYVYEVFDLNNEEANYMFVKNGEYPGYTLNELNKFIDESVDGNKYLKEIAAILHPMGLIDWIPTSECMNILQMWYDLYRSLIGISSNIDYLNAGRVLFYEFALSIIKRINEIKINDEGQENLLLYVNHLDYQKIPISILKLRANYSVWYNNYRDVLLETKAPEPVTIDEITDEEICTLILPRQRCWAKDGYTTALDNPGTGYVGVPTSIQYDNGIPYLVYNQNIASDMSNKIFDLDANNVYKVSIGDESWNLPTGYLSGLAVKNIEPISLESNGFSLYQLDAAQRAQKWLQKALFFGNRIADFYYMRFGVRFLDERLRIPEWIKSTESIVRLDVVMNPTNITTEAGGKVYQSVAGDRSAYASAYDEGGKFEHFCPEHGFIMSYLTIMPETTYAYGMDRDYSKLDQFDFRFKEFATLGMDAVYDTELTFPALDSGAFPNIVVQHGLDTRPQVFGYQGKYYDNKWKPNEEHGELLDSQNMYTFARRFNMYNKDGRPKLNYEFVHCFPDLDMFVVDNETSDYFRFEVKHKTTGELELPPFSLYI